MISKIEELEAKRGQKREENAQLFIAQKLKDLDAICALEDSGDLLNTVSIQVDSWRRGTETMVAFRLPSKIESKRFISVSSKGEERLRQAAEDLCMAIVVYPNREKLSVMLDTYVNLHATIAKAANDLAAGVDDSQKKGL